MTDKPEFLGGKQSVIANPVNDPQKAEDLINESINAMTAAINVIDTFLNHRDLDETQFFYWFDQKNNLGSALTDLVDRQVKHDNDAYEATPIDIKAEAMKAHKALYEDTK